MILISGASGFVGTHLKEIFVSRGIRVTEISRESTSPEIVSWDDFFANPINADVWIHLAGKAHDTRGTYGATAYDGANYELTRRFFNAFCQCEARFFIFLSSVKAAADQVEGVLTETDIPNPKTPYGISKLKAERYVLNHLPIGKKVFVLRPCMIHGKGNKGNLNLLNKVISKNLPWPLGAFQNKRSYCSIDNLMFIFNELIEREDIPSGIYNVADDEPLSTNELIGLMAQAQNRNPKIWNISKKFIESIASIGDKLHLPLNTERLQKLTSSYVVSNAKIKAVIGKPLPLSSREGLLKTLNSFKNK
jgi:nucleoside-diphosphate-sugar epimerase